MILMPSFSSKSLMKFIITCTNHTVFFFRHWGCEHCPNWRNWEQIFISWQPTASKSAICYKSFTSADSQGSS
jgi:hypothetical protein